MAEVLNEYFNSIFTTEDISSLPVPFTKVESNKSEHLGQLFVTPEMIAKKIKKMKDNKSPGVVTRRRNSSFRMKRSKYYTAI